MNEFLYDKILCGSKINSRYTYRRKEFKKRYNFYVKPYGMLFLFQMRRDVTTSSLSTRRIVTPINVIWTAHFILKPS